MKQADLTFSTRLVAGLCLLVALGTIPAAALQPPASADSFAGTWEAKFQGKIFLTLELRVQDGRLTGTIGRSSLQLNATGDLTRADAKDGSNRIVGSKLLDEHTARITALDDDTQDTTQFEMKVTGTNQAEIQLLSAPQGTATAKPWALERIPAADTNAAAGSKSAPPDVKSKLAAAAQVWLAGQFGTGAANTGGDANSSAAVPSDAAASGTTTAGEPDLKISDAPLDAGLRKDIDAMPRRVHDRFNNQGDMVNFVLVGSEKEVQAALEAADWHVADTDDREAALNAIMQTFDKKDYLAMPMSSLYLYGRRQDFGYEMAEPYAMVASRHHFRIWKAPFTWDGKTVWAGAGTHDIGFEKDQRNGKVTHKIDPAVDGERANIGSSLQKSGKVKTLTYYLPPDPVLGAKNATGGGYRSDGRILVIQLQ